MISSLRCRVRVTRTHLRRELACCMIWSCKDARIKVGKRPLIMGILNLTPDSFSDGGLFDEPAAAICRAREMLRDGADLIDIGGESTRPGATGVSEDEELRRTIPVVEALWNEEGPLISIDTRKAEVARRAIEAGAAIVNDVSALTYDPEMVSVVAGTGAGAVLMHMKGNPRMMQDHPAYEDVLGDVVRWLSGRLEACRAAGIDKNQIGVDPGIGFGKSVDHNLALLAGIPALRKLGQPVMIGLSRKSFLGQLTGRDTSERKAASIAGKLWAAGHGADILRVHDVRETVDAMKVLHAVESWNE